MLRHIELVPERVPETPRYPFDIPAIAKLGTLSFNRGVTVLVGENGSGKSTLLEAIAIKAGFNAEGGSKHFRTAQRPSESDLHEALRIAREPPRERTGFFLRAETMFNVFTEAEVGQYQVYGWEAMHERSHGESFLWVALNRFGPRGLYLLDEPESALSPQRQLALLARMKQLVAQGSQFILSTHSLFLMAYPGATLYHLDDAGISTCRLEETTHYAITRRFIDQPERTVRDVLDGS